MRLLLLTKHIRLFTYKRKKKENSHTTQLRVKLQECVLQSLPICPLNQTFRVLKQTT